MDQADTWLRNVQITILAPRCLLCHAPAGLERALCAGCCDDLPWLGASCCHCALALSPDTQGTICIDCARRPRFETAIAAFAYREPIRWLIAQLKFGAQRAHARLLGDLLADCVTTTALRWPEQLVAVPLHRYSYRRRGFNQAELIARRLSRRLALPLAGGLVERQRDTARQSELNANQRAANIRDAFACHCNIRGRHVAIVDDVATTTQTAAALAGALRRAGAARVDLYCVARA